MQIIHKKIQSCLFSHGSSSILIFPLATCGVEYSEKVSGVQDWAGWQVNMLLVKTQQSFA